MNRLIKPIAILAGTVIAGVAIVTVVAEGPEKTPSSSQPSDNSVQLQPSKETGFSALGRLEPASRIRDLAPPTQVTDVQPRIASLFVEEGQKVRKGQILAVFDTYERLFNQRQAILIRLKAVENQVRILNQETSRYRIIASQNAYPKSDLEAKELRLLDLKTEVKQIRSELKRNAIDLSLSQLKSPINGRVLKIYSQPGERPSPYGLLKVGETTNMIAVAQVNEEYISKVSVGQQVKIRSENQSFSGYIDGRVIRIAPIIGVRKSLSLDPKVETDTESRVIDVEVALDKSTNTKVENLSGAKIIAIFAK